MRHQQKIAVAAAARNTPRLDGVRQSCSSPRRQTAHTAAAYPRSRPPVADPDALRLRLDRHHLADALVPHGERQLDAALRDGEPLAAAEVEIAVRNVQVAVTDAGGQHLHQHLGAGRRGGRLLGELQRRAALADLEASHCKTHMVAAPTGHRAALSSHSGRAARGRSDSALPPHPAAMRRPGFAVLGDDGAVERAIERGQHAALGEIEGRRLAVARRGRSQAISS